MFIGGAILGAGVLGAIGSTAAANTQSNAQQASAQTQWNMFNTINQQQQPFIQGGYSALNQLMYGLNGSGGPTAGVNQIPGGGTSTSAYMPTPDGGVQQMMTTGNAKNPQPVMTGGTGPGSTSAAPGGSGSMGGITAGQFTSGFTPQDFTNNLDPGYQFQLQTGGQAVRNADTPGVGALSGAALKDLMGFNQGMAATGYQNAYNRWNTTNNAIFGRLSGIAGLGQNAAANVGTSGTTLGTGIAQAGAAAGASNAAGIVGATNSIGGSAVPLGYLMSGQQTPPSTGGGGFGAALAATNVANYGYPSGAGT
jgi:hypothetical protein